MTDKRQPAADVINAERPAGDRPLPSTEPRTEDRPWLGSAAGEVNYWKQRALAAEAVVAALRGEIARLRDCGLDA